jgi:hypothetical protein
VGERVWMEVKVKFVMNLVSMMMGWWRWRSDGFHNIFRFGCCLQRRLSKLTLRPLN